MVGQTAILREAVGLFHEPEKLHAAVSELQSCGFDRAEISLLAREGILDGDVAKDYADMHDAERDPAAPRQAVVGETDVRQARTLGTSMAAVVAAFAALGITIFSGGAAAAALAAAAAAGGGAGAVGYALGQRAGHDEDDHIRQQLDRGGVLLWVRTRDAEHERRAGEILWRHGATDVQILDTPVSGSKQSDAA
jgi:hypothetical protein